MMFVTDLTMFAENGFYPVISATYRCMCEVHFDLSIAQGIEFHVKCDECGQRGIVSTDNGLPGVDPIEPFLMLDPVFILEGAEIKELTEND